VFYRPNQRIDRCTAYQPDQRTLQRGTRGSVAASVCRLAVLPLAARTVPNEITRATPTSARTYFKARAMENAGLEDD